MPIKPENVNQYLESGCGRCELGGTPQCKVHSWVKELGLLVEILEKTELTAAIKWGVPCYMYKDKNILTLSAFKDSVVVSFFQGAQMQDPQNLLEKPGENSIFARYIRFTDIKSNLSLEQTLLGYIQDAININTSGKKVHAMDDAQPEYPEELIQIMEKNPDFEEAFSALTPGRQRGYLIYFSSAKHSKTRVTRIEKSMPQIFSGKGWNER